MILLDISTFIQENSDMVKFFFVTISSFIMFFLITNRVFSKAKVRLEDIERNTNIMKNDFREIKKFYETENEELLIAQKNDKISLVINKMLYENQSVIRNEFIAIKSNTLQLSSAGYIVAVDIDLKGMINRNWNKFLPYLQDLEKNYSTHPYDLQYYCLYLGSCWEQFFTPEDISEIKHYAYEEGHIVAAYFAIIGILIRDRYFKGLTPIPKFNRKKAY